MSSTIYSETGAEPGDKGLTPAERQAILSEEFTREVIRVAEGVHVAVGFGASNSVLVHGEDGAIIVDTQYGTEAARLVRDAFREITDKPIVAIFLTHSHSDHIGGTAVFAEGHSPEIYARPASERALNRYSELSDVLSIRARRQFGSDLPREDKIDGIAPVVRPDGGIGAGKVSPTRLLTSDREELILAGVDMTVLAGPGETDDHLLIWLPATGVLIAGDNFYFSFPNLYAIRGTSYRDVSEWINTLDRMIDFDAEHLITGHARPVSGRENVRMVLTDYRNAIDHVLSSTLKGANRGLSPDELAAGVVLPDSLAEKPYLREFYGVVPWSVRSIYSGYLGWFDGNPTQLFPLTPAEEAGRMVELAGSAGELLDAAQQAVDAGDHQWGCELIDHLLVLEPQSADLKRLKARALRELATKQISSNARHYFLSCAKQLEESI
jgi:uncharacterized sulfatase